MTAPIAIDYIISAIAFFILITGLILIHEIGHFFAARKAGVEVEEFGFGLPPKLKNIFHWKGTDFTLNWIPFGGFVRLKGEGAVEEPERTAPGSFARASIFARSMVLIAGVGMNFFLAVIIFLFGFSYGQWVPTYMNLEDMQAASARGEIDMRLGVLIEDVMEGGNAAAAGVPKGSILDYIDGTPVTRAEDVAIFQQGKSSVTYTYRDNLDATQQHTLTVPVKDGATGVYVRTTTVHLSAPVRGPLEAVRLSMRETGLVTTQTVLGIYKLIVSLVRNAEVPEGVTGIVGIAQLTDTAVREGFAVYLRLVALLSLSLAVLNILPFPALDGGRLLFVLSELFIKPGNRKFEIMTNTVGFGVLLLVILFVTLYDVVRLFI